MAVFIATVEVTPGAATAWTDVDVSAYVPAGATGVLLHLAAPSSNGARNVGLRKNGSTDARTNNYSGSSGDTWHTWGFVGLDANRIFEAFVGSTTLIDIYLTAYFTGDAVFFTNGVEKSVGAGATDDVWTDQDISADTGVDTAIGAIWEVAFPSTGREHNFRKNGSTDNRAAGGTGVRHHWALIGVDVNEICEYIKDTTVDEPIWLVGYIKSGATFNTNAPDNSTAITGSYVDVAALPVGAIAGIYELYGTVDTELWALRQNGASDDIYTLLGNRSRAVVQCDASRLVEQKVSSANVDLFQVGWFETFLAPLSLAVDPGELAVSEQALGTPLAHTVAPGDLEVDAQNTVLSVKALLGTGIAEIVAQSAGLSRGALLDMREVEVTGFDIPAAYSYADPVDVAELVISGEDIGFPWDVPVGATLLSLMSPDVALLTSSNFVASLDNAVISIVDQVVVLDIPAVVVPAQLGITGQGFERSDGMVVTPVVLQITASIMALDRATAVALGSLVITGQALTTPQILAILPSLLNIGNTALILNEGFGVTNASLVVTPDASGSEQEVDVDFANLHLTVQEIMLGGELEPIFFKATVHLVTPHSIVHLRQLLDDESYIIYLSLNLAEILARLAELHAETP